MKVRCIVESGSISEGTVYEVAGVCQVGDGPWHDQYISFVIFNDQEEWQAYPSHLFEPARRGE